MTKFFVDTNVILDWLIPTNSFHDEATEFMRNCFSDLASAFISSHSLTDIFYITRKYFPLEDRRQFLMLIVSKFHVIAENQEDFKSVLSEPDFFDLEDGLQIKCAEKTNIDYIVTENLKDFKNSKIPALNISDALRKI